MQSVCTLLPDEYFQKTVQLRAALAEDPTLGAIYDPPFVHFTLQLAAEYDWPSLEAGMNEYARGQQPFEVRTIGLLVFTGTGTTIAVAPYRDDKLAKFQASVWDIASRCAQGRVDQFYHPDRWIPHVTIKRCGPHTESFGRAMAKLASESFVWTMTVDNVTVQHDPGQNSLTHYQRLRFPPGGKVPQAGDSEKKANATVLTVDEARTPDGAPRWIAKVRLDSGPEIQQEWSAPQVTRIMAVAKSSVVHFRDARCCVEEDRVVDVIPNTPFSIVG